MAFTDAYIRNLKTTKSMEDFREKTGENFGVRVYSVTEFLFVGANGLLIIQQAIVFLCFNSATTIMTYAPQAH